MKINAHTVWNVIYSDIDDDAGCEDPEPYITNESQDKLDEDNYFVAETRPEYAIYLANVPKLVQMIKKLIHDYYCKDPKAMEESVLEAKQLLSWLESETAECIHAGKEISAFRAEIIKNKPLRWNLPEGKMFHEVYPEIEAKYDAWRKMLNGKWLYPY